MPIVLSGGADTPGEIEALRIGLKVPLNFGREQDQVTKALGVEQGRSRRTNRKAAA